jgi:hypothetical protein
MDNIDTFLNNAELRIDYVNQELPSFMTNLHHKDTLFELLFYCNDRWINYYRLYKSEMKRRSYVDDIQRFYMAISTDSDIFTKNILCAIDFIIDLGYTFSKQDILILYRATNTDFRDIFQMIKFYIDLPSIQRELTLMFMWNNDYEMLQYCYENGFIMSKNIFNEAIKDNKKHEIKHLQILCECSCPSYNTNDVEYDIYDPITLVVAKILIDNGRTLPYSICYNAMRNKSSRLFKYARKLGYEYEPDDKVDIGGLIL